MLDSEAKSNWLQLNFKRRSRDTYDLGSPKNGIFLLKIVSLFLWGGST